ncbi:hypothetical protein O3G_MSEX006950 [Manduca sexta]|uniref:CCHC-type domain-containing protein n=1 Tax=Manduca sexta TaxID=7130 RepID=A0A921Z5F4_MANSE|nr:hypothetical protein O3G_MSEX006950 [Manduca sexta]
MAGPVGILNGITMLKNRERYAIWKFKMRMLLIHEELWSTVSGYADDDKTPPEVRFRNDQKALSKICLTVDGGAITHVRTATTAKIAWDALQTAFEDKSLGRKLALERKLYRYTLSDFADLESYIIAITTTAQDLADIGKKIEDSSLAAIILGGLTSRYEPLIMALEHSNIEVTSEMVKTKLLSEMSRETERDVPALRSLHKKGIICYKCRKPGHKSPNCPLKKDKPSFVYNKKEAKRETGLVVNNEEERVTNSKQVITEMSLSALESKDFNRWIVDSGATVHITPRADWFINYRPIDGGTITVANGEKLAAIGVGDVSIDTNNGVCRISDVVHVPRLNCNLLSVKQVVEKGFLVNFDKNGCNFYKTDDVSYLNNAAFHGSYSGGLVHLDCSVRLPQNIAYIVNSELSKFQLWHKRLGHLCRIGMDLLRKGLAVGVKYVEVDKEPCIPCIEGKQARKPFKRLKYKRATSALELVHTDVCGPMSTTSFKDFII